MTHPPLYPPVGRVTFGAPAAGFHIPSLMKLRLTATLLTDDDTEIALAESIIVVDGAIKLKPLIAEVQTDLNAVAMSLLTKHERRRKPVGVE